MFKVSTFLSDTEFGRAAIPLFGPADAHFEKTASTSLMPDVLNYIASLKPKDGSIYVLVNALGAGEYYGSNVNGDFFPEAALIHAPSDWKGVPLLDQRYGKTWPYGYPTFYDAHAFAHHKNKDPSRAYGDVEYAGWNDKMKRVELVTRIDRDKCDRFGGMSVWDRLREGQFPDVSMGCLPAGSLITMGDGIQKPIELVQESEWVLTHTGSRRRVTETMRYRHRGSIFKLKAYGFPRELVLTGNHPLWLVDGDQLECHPRSVSDRAWSKELVSRHRHCTPTVRAESRGCSTCSVEPSYEFEWRRADEAQVGDYLAFPVPQTIDDSVDSKALARLLGYYLAEGHVSNYNQRPLEQITFSLGFEEKDLALEIEALGRQLGVEVLWHEEKERYGARSVVLVSKSLAQKCLEWCGAGAKTKRLSRETLFMSPSLQLEFLGAYLNGDGGTYHGSAYFSTSSETLAHQIFIVLARCGMIASVNTIEHRPSEKSVVRKDTTEFQIWVGTDFSWKLGAVTKKPVRKSLKIRGQRFFYEKGGTVFLMSPILEISEESYDDDVFNFSVDVEESYVAEGLTVHNSRVPFDTCSITLDKKKYQEGLSTFDPSRHKHPGIAALEFHKKLKEKDGVGIRGLAITRADYSSYCRDQMNQILRDGRKVFVYNDFPRFFDISYVFIGADRTAKVMVFISINRGVSSAHAAEHMGFHEKTAELKDATIRKRGEIKKDVPPNLPPDKAVPILTRGEPSFSKSVMDALCSVPISGALSTTAGLGMILRPQEFQRIVLSKMGKGDLADELDSKNVVFPSSDQEISVDMKGKDFSPALAKKLLSSMSMRSGLSPIVHQRLIIIAGSSTPEREKLSSLPDDLLRKIGAAYNGYRRGVLELVANTQDFIQQTNSSEELLKVASQPVEEVFTPLSFQYLQTAFMDELPSESMSSESVFCFDGASVQRETPSRITWM